MTALKLIEYFTTIRDSYKERVEIINFLSTTGSISDDRLSFSTASFDSARCLTEASTSTDDDSSGDEGEKEKVGDEVDELSSDWDWSSADEDEQKVNLVALLSFYVI